MVAVTLATMVAMGLLSAPALAQAPPLFAPPVLDQLVSRIALYPDPLRP
jgi:hypothetical protein